MSRKAARETVMKLLYQMDIGGILPDEVINNFYDNYEGKELSEEDRKFIENYVTGVYEFKDDIDRSIESSSKEWKINRIAKVDLSIMRLAIYEMKFREDIPKAVAVNEAIELAKKFGGENSANFINGILGSLIKEYQ